MFRLYSVYIGETGRSFKTRRKEHQSDIKPDIIAQLTNEDLKKEICTSETRLLGKWTPD